MGQRVDRRCDLFSLGSRAVRDAEGKSPLSMGTVVDTMLRFCTKTPKYCRKQDELRGTSIEY